MLDTEVSLRAALVTFCRWAYIKHWPLGVFTTVGLIPIGAILIAYAGDRSTPQESIAMWIGCIATAIGALGVMLNEWAKRAFLQAADRESQQVWVLMKDALHPVLECLGAMPGHSKRDRDADLFRIADGVAHGLWLVMSHIAGVRVVVYALDAAGTGMSHLAVVGRGDSTQQFVAGTPRGDKAVGMVQRGDSLLMADVDEEDSDLYDGSRSGYRSFVSCSIYIGTGPGIRAYGMLTVDAPEPNSFADTDRRIIQLLADHLAVAFAIKATQ